MDNSTHLPTSALVNLGAALMPSIQVDVADLFDAAGHDSGQQPAHAQIIRHLPRLPAPDAPSQQCSICMEHASPDDADASWTRLAPCGHCFHRACCARWLEQHHTCPLCRVAVQLNTDGMTTRQMLGMLTELGIERDHTVVERQELAQTLQRALATEAGT